MPHRIERNAALLHAAQQLEDQAPAFGVVLVVVFNAVVVIGELGVRICRASGPEGEIDVVGPHLLVPEGFAQSAGLAVAGKNRLVDYVPRLQLAGVVLADCGDVIDKKLARVRTILRGLDPRGDGLVPAKRVAAHEHVMALGEGEQEVGARKIVAIGRGAQRDPLQLAGRHNDAALLADQFSKIGIALHIVNDDCGAEDEAMAARMSTERARTRDVVK